MSEIADLFFKPKINRGFFYGGAFKTLLVKRLLKFIIRQPRSFLRMFLLQAKMM